VDLGAVEDYGLRMIAARVRFATTQTMIDDQGLDVPSPTMHELVGTT
jgi:hypothetical protein